ncbi:SagB family peptide dehydrogenase [Lentibacillus saliphilus]|uniref:SagB family peptide dehydrogenase n=1 Tax=Lentibacillus saliphilus TaxID=2737028 RepID=UPI001C300FBB|nr:SagB family peptide dehydrogenase [Lentibacillus saliphilus]
MNKGLMNLHSLIYQDESNVANLSNTKLYASILNGHADSNAFNYLLGMTSLGISDIRALNFYNESGLANQINASRQLEEITDGARSVILPKPKNLKGSLVNALKSRKSTRAFTNHRMLLTELSTLLKYTVGLSERSTEDAEGKKSYHRYHSSGGGLYPITVYCAINDIEGLDNGIYAYRPYTHTLELIQSEYDLDLLYENAPIDTQRSNLSLLFNYDVNRNYLKYGELGLLLAFVETGIMAQNIHLVAKHVGYSTCDVAGFNKKYAEKTLHLDSINAHVIYSIIIGKER